MSLRFFAVPPVRFRPARSRASHGLDEHGVRTIALTHEPRRARNPKSCTPISQITPIAPKTRRVVRTPSSVLGRDGFAFEGKGLGTHGLPEVGSRRNRDCVP